MKEPDVELVPWGPAWLGYGLKDWRLPVTPMDLEELMLLVSEEPLRSMRYSWIEMDWMCSIGFGIEASSGESAAPET